MSRLEWELTEMQGNEATWQCRRGETSVLSRVCLVDTGHLQAYLEKRARTRVSVHAHPFSGFVRGEGREATSGETPQYPYGGLRKPRLRGASASGRERKRRGRKRAHAQVSAHTYSCVVRGPKRNDHVRIAVPSIASTQTSVSKPFCENQVLCGEMANSQL